MRTVFMGTPEFGVPSLRKLHDQGHEIALVVTQPDRPAGRGRKVSSSAIKRAALELGLPVDQPESVNASEFLDRLRAIRPDLIVVVAFGQILSEDVLGKAWENIRIPGRIEVIGERPWVVLDGAHNPASAWALSDSRKRYKQVLHFQALQARDMLPNTILQDIHR